YRFSSFGQAVGGNEAARRGYEAVFCQKRAWEDLMPSYNLILYGKGERAKGVEGKDAGRIDPETVKKVLENGGQVPLWQLLRWRIRYFSEGTALGSKEYLEDLGRLWNEQCGGTRTRHAHCMRSGDWGELRSYRNLQVNPVSVPPD
ncbi:MAG: hypothetical protein GVY36_10625, partial [Verrucomicrobia bacterium]|nr:hypothetical protein [Verrucomicrobiota bacterium]